MSKMKPAEPIQVYGFLAYWIYKVFELFKSLLHYSITPQKLSPNNPGNVCKPLKHNKKLRVLIMAVWFSAWQYQRMCIST